MMNILFIGVYKERSGWGEAARRYIRALNTTGNNIICRPITLNNSVEVLDDDIRELESKPNKNIDAVIQCCLPSMFEYSSVPNIGIAFLETGNITNRHPWRKKIELMDCMFAPGLSESDFINKSTVFCPVPFDVKEYDQEFQQVSLEEADHTYKFYFVGELNRRKNITGLIKSYYSSFTRSDNVSLILKVNKYGHNEQSVLREVDSLVRSVAHNMKLYKKFEQYPKIISITNLLPRKDLLNLHDYCDCFVMPSFGEGFCLPLYDAFAMNKQIISNIRINFKSKNYGHIDGISYTMNNKRNVFAMTETIPDIFTYKETWQEPIDSSLSSIMVNNVKKDLKSISHSEKEKRKKMIEAYSFQNTGKRMMHYIHLLRL